MPTQSAFAADLENLEPAARLLGIDPRTWVLTGGEDHGLLATFPPGRALPAQFRPVGRVRARAADEAAGVVVAGSLVTGATGWDHFRAGPG